jgi:dienelactone hydrolase
MNRREWLLTSGGLALPSGSGGFQQPAAGQFPQPDLANLYPLMEWISRGNQPALSFLGAKWKSLDQWKRVARPLFNAHLSYNPDVPALAAVVTDREERDGFTLETVRLRATPAYEIPARLLVPSGRKGRAPGVVAIHCHSGRYVWGHQKILSHPDDPAVLREFRDRAYGRPYAEWLARCGYVVIVIDGFYFGERRLRPEQLDPATAPGEFREPLRQLAQLKPGAPDWLAAVDSLCSRFEHLTAKTIFTAGATWPGMLVWDDMRAVDYLCSRPEVDPSRIGCVGLSIGGLRTAHLAAADPRIKVACVAGWMTEFREQLRNHLRSHTWMIYIPGLYRSLDLPDAVAMTAPGALLVQQCGRDALYPISGMKGAVEKLTRIYAKAGIPERFRATFYDLPHSFRPEMQDEAFAWLEKWL